MKNVKVEKIQIDTYDYNDLIKEYKTKSALIRFLTTKDYTRSEIAKFMNIRYQHVRNVQLQVLKRK